MVTEPEHNGGVGDIGTPSPGQKSKKRKLTPDSEEDLVNKSTDSETDQAQGAERNGGGGPAMQRLASTDRRSSAEAETRLDPAVDPVDGDHDPSLRPPPPLPSANKKKRESSLVAAIAMNGDSSSDENLSDEDRGPSKSKRRSAAGKSKQNRKSESKTASSASPAPPAISAARAPADDEFPRLGDVIWGRMSGFPFWPSFVTKSPQGPHKKVGANGKATYHVQFFNWNDESGWVNAALEFEGLDAFKKIAAKKKSDKSYNPAKGAMYNKWERAARDAEETMELTRSERLDCYLVSYGSNQGKKATPKPSPSARKPTTPKPRKSSAAAASKNEGHQFKIPIDGVKLLKTKMAEAAKKKKRRPSKKKKAPTPSPSPPKPVRTEVKYMIPEVEKEKRKSKPKKKENRPKAKREFKISVSEVCHFLNMTDYPTPVTDEMRETFQDYFRFEEFCVPLLVTVNPLSDPLKITTLCRAKWREVLASEPEAKQSPCQPDCQHFTRPRNNMIWVNTCPETLV